MHEGIKSYHQEIDNACNFLNHIIGELVYKSKMHLNCLQYTNVIIEDQILPLSIAYFKIIYFYYATCINVKRLNQEMFGFLMFNTVFVEPKRYFNKKFIIDEGEMVGTSRAFIKSKDRQHECDVCKKSYFSRKHLLSHKVTHKEERPFSCEKCSASFKLKSSLNSHMKSHNNDRPFKCNICNQKFKLAKNFESHVQSHEGVKKFVCNYCDMKFYSESTLRCHMNIHTKPNRFRCTHDGCEKTFNFKHHLLNHVRLHTGNNPISIFKNYFSFMIIILELKKMIFKSLVFKILGFFTFLFGFDIFVSNKDIFKILTSENFHMGLQNN